jgi:hypothetical protein
MSHVTSPFEGKIAMEGKHQGPVQPRPMTFWRCQGPLIGGRILNSHNKKVELMKAVRHYGSTVEDLDSIIL